MTKTPAMEALLRHDRMIVGAILVSICLLCWWYVLIGAGTGMSAMAMTTWRFPPAADIKSMASQWTLFYWIVMLVMWWGMMIAMMLPSAAPMILLYARVCRHAQDADQREPVVIPTAAFIGGYLLAWLGFSLVATTVQWSLEQGELLHSMLMWSTNKSLSAALLITAALYQFSPLKTACLKHCRAPADFLSSHWRKGCKGALRMGLVHGMYCVGCCWVLMALLFAVGIMNLVWIAALAIIVLLEKVVPNGQWIARAIGGIMMIAGIYVLLA